MRGTGLYYEWCLMLFSDSLRSCFPIILPHLTKLLSSIKIKRIFSRIHGKGVITIAYVRVDDNEPLEKSIKKFKRMVEKEGIIREWKKREYFEKPSTIENRKKKALARKQMKKVRKMHSMKSY